MRRSNTKCFFCDQAPATTRDHVPPSCLFPEPMPGNLITVPACLPCNAGWSKDGEYFRAVLLACANLANDKSACSVRDVVVRSLRRPQAKGFATLIREAFIDVELQSAGGIHLGDGVAVRVDVPRLHNVLRRTIRGLFFGETHRVLPAGHEIRVVLDQFGDRVRDIMTQVFPGGVRAEIRRVSDVFEYSMVRLGDYPTSLWVGSFFRRVLFMAVITLPEKTVAR